MEVYFEHVLLRILGTFIFGDNVLKTFVGNFENIL
jgi:hypothetical protein